jgi:peptidoglycan/LPS O-acetylase OafA/YrhL
MRADSLAAGALAAVLVRSESARAALIRHRGTMLGALGVALLGAAGFVAKGWTTHASAPMAIIGYSWLAALYTLVLLLAVTDPGGRLASMLRMRWLRSLGEIAFGVYLLHVAVLGVCFGVVLGRRPVVRDPRDLGVSLLAAVVTVGLARLSWVVLESRMVRWGHRYGYAEGATKAGAPHPVRAPSSSTLETRS